MLVKCDSCDIDILTEADPHMIRPHPYKYFIFCGGCGIDYEIMYYAIKHILKDAEESTSV